MKRTIILILLSAITTLGIVANPNWKIHPIFDEEITHIIDTHDYVYFTSRNMIKNTSLDTYFGLFRYDKDADELIALSTDNLLSGNQIQDVVYNPSKGYIAVLYQDFNIDLIYNDGSVTSIPYYAQAQLGYSKNVNAISIDPDNDRIYLATIFGYVAINDKKNEIADSRIYDTSLSAFCRVADKYFAIDNTGHVICAPVNQPRLNISDYKQLDLYINPLALLPLDDKLLVVYNNNVNIVSVNGDEIKIINTVPGYNKNLDYNKKGLSISSSGKLYQVTPDGNFTAVTLPSEFSSYAAASDNMIDIWVAEKRKGLASFKLSGDEYAVTRNFMMPNAPAVYISTSFANHPTKGLMMLNYGYTPQTVKLYQNSAFQLSSHKNGIWTNHSPAYTDPANTNIMTMTNGFVVDPDNPSIVYVTSPFNGLLKMNLDNPDDKIHLSRTNDPDASNNWFVPFLPVQNFWSILANLSPPYFDAKGNMWMNFPDYDYKGDYKPQLYCWTAEDRRASTSASNVKLPQKIEINSNVDVANTSFVKPLFKTGSGLLLFAGNLTNEIILLIDTKNTPLNPSDDKVYKFPAFIDGDGTSINISQTKFLWEDPQTGYVWIGHNSGVCYFIPSQVLAGNYQVNRVKVSRNDGTNLADYLLEGVRVNQMTSDSQGRKWFATHGAGVLCTSSDGREILMEFNSSNSPMPSDVAYGIAYDPEANSMMISTDGGLAEYFLTSSQQSSNGKSDVRAYPNPVRPDFSNYVTITDIPEGSMVKITDSGGNLVKDLGRMSGSEILWDVSDSNFRRVASGVYYILISPSNENGSYSAVGKILVVS